MTGLPHHIRRQYAISAPHWHQATPDTPHQPCRDKPGHENRLVNHSAPNLYFSSRDVKVHDQPGTRWPTRPDNLVVMVDPHPPIYEAHYTRSPYQLLGGQGWKRLAAFRVDDEGVTLGGAPARHRSQTAFAPWADITSVVIWQWSLMHGAPTWVPADQTMDYIGVSRRPGAPSLPGPNSKMDAEQTRRQAPHIDHQLFLASRAINLWRLDPERLRTAVTAFAPHVPVHDVRNTG